MSEKPRAKAYVYTRVSTAMQVDGFSLDAQRDEIRRFAELKKIDIVGEYCDEGKSGKNTKNRTEFNRMLADIKQKKDDVRYVLVFKLSRFARNAADTLENLRAMQNCGVDLLCTEDGMDSSSTSGKLIISIMSAFAEMELENIHTQTMAGRRQKAKEGKLNGGFAPYGYKLVDGFLTIVEDEAETVRYIFELFTTTPLGANGVAKRLNAEGIAKNERSNGKHTVFTGDFIKKTLDNPVYMGKIAYGRRKTEKVAGDDGKTHIVKEKDESNIIISEGVHDAIVSEEVWKDAHEKRIRTGVKKEKLEKEHEYILSGLLRCPACGKPMYGIPSRKKRKDGTPYPVSYAYKCRQSKKLTGIDCTFNKQFNCREIDAEVSTAISMCFITPEIVERIRAEMNREYDVSELETKLETVKKNQNVLLARKKKLEQSRDALDPLDRNFDMKFDSFTDSLDKVFDELREVERVIESIEIKIRTATNSKKTKEDAIQLLLEFGQMYPTLPEAEQKKIANVLIESIEIFPTKRAYGYLKTIHFSFPVLSGDEIKQTMSIWDTHPDILDEEGNFNGYNPEDDLPPVEMETGTIVVHDEGEVFPPKRITDETVVLLSRKKVDEERSVYKSWSDLKKQMNSFLCDSLKDKISYFYTSYHEVHNAYGRATINYNKKEIIAFSWVERYTQQGDIVAQYEKMDNASLVFDDCMQKYEFAKITATKDKWMPNCTLCETDFINSMTIYLKTNIASSLHSDNYLLRVFAYMDRRVGKRSLIKIKDEVEKLPDWVKQFYQIRCEADGIFSPHKSNN